MRKGIVLAGIIISSFIFLSTSVFACISFPNIITKNNCTIRFEINNYNNKSAIINELNEKKLDCGIKDNDLSLISDYIYNGYSVKEQNNDEYNVFLKEVKDKNQVKGCGSYYSAAYHLGNWTGYVENFKVKDEKDNLCPQPNCIGASAYLVWNDLNPLVGNDSDEHGCKASAGYSWCGEKNKCLRIWEENCSKVKIMPETASAKAIERLKELGFNVAIDRVGNSIKVKEGYHVSGTADAKLFGIFEKKATIDAEVDSETGEVVEIHKPWWAFLASGI